MRARRLLALCTAALLGSVALAVPATAVPDPGTTRIAGTDRYDTAIRISQATYEAADAAYIANGEGFADALAAGPLAAGDGAPLLLVPRSGPVPAGVVAELRRLGVRQLYVMGGEAAISAQVETELRAIAPDVLRLEGTDRYNTAGLAAYVATERGRPVFLATGTDFPDALAAGAVAGRLGGSVMLTAPSSLPAITAQYLQLIEPSSVIVVGGGSVVAEPVLEQVRAAVPGVEVSRLAGADRYATAAAVSRLGTPGGADLVYLATGLNFPDALAGAAVAGPSGAALVLTDPRCVPAATLAEVQRLGAPQVVALGGPAVVSDAAQQLTPCAAAPPVVQPPAAAALSIALDPPSIVRGQSSTVFVAGVPGERVSLYAFTVPSSTFSVIRTGTVGASGLVSWPISPSDYTRLYAAPDAGPASRASEQVVLAVTAPGTACSATAPLVSYDDSAQCLYAAFVFGDSATAHNYAEPDVVDLLFSWRDAYGASPAWEYFGCGPAMVEYVSSGISCGYYEHPVPGDGMVHGVAIEFNMAPGFWVESIDTFG